MKCDYVLCDCYIRGKSGDYIACCMTLNLIVAEDTYEKVYDLLDDEIEDYLEVVRDIKLEGVKYGHLLNRPVPGFMYWDYILMWIKNLFTKKKYIWDKWYKLKGDEDEK